MFFFFLRSQKCKAISIKFFTLFILVHSQIKLLDKIFCYAQMITFCILRLFGTAYTQTSEKNKDKNFYKSKEKYGEIWRNQNDEFRTLKPSYDGL